MLSENITASELPRTVGSRKSVKDSFDFEFQSRLHECEAATAREKSILFAGSRYAFVCRLFLLPESRFEKVFEQNASGILSDERFSKLLQSYEKEQKALTQEVSDSQKTLQEAKQKVTDLRLLLRTLRELTDITELTPTLVNSLIERIEVHNNDKSSGHCYVKVDIYFTAVGMIDIPTEQEILAMMKEIRENPQDFRFVA